MDKLKAINKYYLYFVGYALIGWIYEVFLEVAVYRWGFSNRGFLFGPYLPVYGFGALLFIVFLTNLKNKKIKIFKINISPLLVFLGAGTIATVVELLTSYLLELTSGKWLWDYADYAYNFQGRIALNPSIRFGLGGLLFLYVVQPVFERILGRTSEKYKLTIGIVLFITMTVDLIIKVIF